MKEKRAKTPMEIILEEQKRLNELKDDFANTIILLSIGFMKKSGGWIDRIEFEYSDGDYKADEINEEDIEINIVLQEDNG